MYWILGIALAAIVIDRSGSSPPTQPDPPEPATTEPTDSTTGDKLDGDFADVLDGAEVPDDAWEAFGAAHVDVLSLDPGDSARPDDPLAQQVAQVFEQSRAQLLSSEPPHLLEHRSGWQRVCNWGRRRRQAARVWWRRHWRTVVDLLCDLFANQRAHPDHDRTAGTIRLIQTVVRLE